MIIRLDELKSGEGFLWTDETMGRLGLGLNNPKKFIKYENGWFHLVYTDSGQENRFKLPPDATVIRAKKKPQYTELRMPGALKKGQKFKWTDGSKHHIGVRGNSDKEFISWDSGSEEITYKVLSIGDVRAKFLPAPYGVLVEVESDFFAELGL